MCARSWPSVGSRTPKTVRSFGFGLFGLASQGRIVAVGLVIGGVIIGPFFVDALGRVSERRNCRNSGGDGSSEVGDIGHTDPGLLATGRTGAAFLSWVPELPVLGLLGRGKLEILFVRVVPVLDVSDLVNVGLRDKPLSSSVGVAPTATTAAEWLMLCHHTGLYLDVTIIASQALHFV